MTKKDEDPYLHEWDTGMESIARFDGTLVDLRKYGFSFITGLITAQGFFGYANTDPLIRIIAILVTMVLVVILYWLDKYYFSLLYGMYVRLRFLERFRLDTKLNTIVGGLNNKGGKDILLAIYIGFLSSLLVAGILITLYNTPTMTEDPAQKDISNKTLVDMSVQKPTAISHSALLPLIIGGFAFSLGVIIYTRRSLYDKMIEHVEGAGNLFDTYDKVGKYLDEFEKGMTEEERDRHIREFEGDVFDMIKERATFEAVQKKWDEKVKKLEDVNRHRKV